MGASRSWTGPPPGRRCGSALQDRHKVRDHLLASRGQMKGSGRAFIGPLVSHTILPTSLGFRSPPQPKRVSKLSASPASLRRLAQSDEIVWTLLIPAEAQPPTPPPAALPLPAQGRP
jgi:hypothetical protein